MPVGFLKSFVAKFAARPVDWDELEEALIRADLGVPMARKILDSLRGRGHSVTGETAAGVARKVSAATRRQECLWVLNQ